MTHIRKIGLVDVNEEGLLVVLKEGGSTWILPGGKPEIGEDDETALRREVDEELSCGVLDLRPLTVVRADAADRPGDTVDVHCFLGTLNAEPSRAAEIAAVRRVSIDHPEVPLAPSIVDGLLPLLRTRARRSYRVYERRMLVEGEKARIDFGLSDGEDGLFDAAELSIVWENVGSFEALRLSLYDDALAALSGMPDLVAALAASHGAKQVAGTRRGTLTRGEVVAILDGCGFVDRTPEPEPSHGTVLYAVRRTDGAIVHNATAAWKALDWCRRAKQPFGTMLEVIHSAMDADLPLDGEQHPIATFEFHDEGTPPVERDITGRIVTEPGI